MKRFVTLICLVLGLCALSGCVCFDSHFEIREDGSVTYTGFDGLTVETANELISTGDLVLEGHEVTEVYNGITYLGEHETFEFDVYTEIDWATDGITITKTGDSYAFSFNTAVQLEALREEAGAADYAEMYTMLEDAYVMKEYNFPWPVTQTGGPSEGVEIDGNTLRINLLKAQPAVHTFYSGQGGQFTDVSNQAWYRPAVYAMWNGGLVNGYGDGSFGPGDNITLSAICTILARVDGVDVTATAGEYWAKKAIDYCVAQGYINPQGDSTPEHYDRYATREEITAAISRAYAGFNVACEFKVGIDDKAGVVKDMAWAEYLLRALYDETGYCVYLMTNPGAEVDFQKVYADVFGKATNGIVVALNYDGDKVSNESAVYYGQRDPDKAHIATLFGYAVDPIESLTLYSYELEERTEDVKDVSIPDADQIASDYLDDIKAAYKVGLCSGSDASGTFNPKANITRAEVCQLFYNINWTAPGVS